ncbi:hypothetical protein BJV85_002487 [Clostridium acetobutylicum]|uniref:DUF4367 domain-containing protein n=1 Tax=Clostridium acetobutylicum (strain ATCC 824 / DSM 792 / JCM 1419 / IAM 19013 / LMG 5710 / NBRC 13948 / NRRL B-527 / VKM B-1787 / 2291 / W) TaxID=272562 RepID=Q97IY0_CLOAB|nr:MULTISPECIES: hypothetical protein [Clostridium]AAK79477.1 Hypothetical protein CA_C1510 [Clostridium acetobutylicum ATCC 824]ADZ20562.1 Conserved hypothetical protein [Clostridium acetobutylicum EA 2018]AEI31848.1 hypothetical protein SMB_G1535 [Clostridium acetobutylicum DSM 1731]AWV81278.1 hypothetical protein DK921_14495 [Clostridium acetobutylicum]MBC2392912.1 hypothetical protein [Clostridium acetobutylicum]
MNKKDIENKFSSDIEDYIDGLEKIDNYKDEEYDELFKFGKILANKDFSKKINKDYIYEKCLKNINKKKGENNMKKSDILMKVAAASVAFVVAGAAFMQTSFAKDLSDKILKQISIGRINAVKVQVGKGNKSKEVPENLKGKIFDKNGKVVTKITKENCKDLYTKNGEKISDFTNGKIVTVKEREAQTYTITNVNDVNKYTCFKVILPSYLPSGYKFDYAKLYKDKNGNFNNNKYITMYFKNPKNPNVMFLQERLSCEETKYTMGGEDDIKKIKINNVDAVLSGNESIDWEYNKSLYSLILKGISVNELEKIAESIK